MAEKSQEKKAPEDLEADLPINKNKRHRKPKPWDNPNDGIDRWKFVEINPGDMKAPLLEESSFATLFPKYREKYIKEVWTIVKKSLWEHGIKAELDLIEGSMTVRTTSKVWDPYIIIKARDVIKLLARSVPYQTSLKVLEEETYCDIIKIAGMVPNKEKFVKRRQRLIGPNGNTLKALELLTNCYIMVQGSTVSAVGHYKQMKTVRKIVEDCMRNIHPIYHIKELMIKRQLMQDDKLKGENWDRFLPNFKKRISNLKKKKVEIKKREKSIFPPLPQPRKEDIAMETGEYFLTKTEKSRKLKEKKSIDAAEKKSEKLKKNADKYKAPEQDDSKLKKRAPKEVTLEDMKEKFGVKKLKLDL